jgi:uncharacterized protein (DUF1786 family)
MNSTDARFTGSIPAIYDEYMVPLLFEPYARDLAERLRGVREGVLIEVAAGTGAVTRALRASLPAAVQLIATDLNEGMLAMASRRVSDPSVVFRHADAQKLGHAPPERDRSAGSRAPRRSDGGGHCRPHGAIR